MTTPTRRSASVARSSSRTPSRVKHHQQTRVNTSTPTPLFDGDIPIDPSLLDLTPNVLKQTEIELDDMEDAEGELVDDELDLIPVGSYDPTQYLPPSATPSSSSYPYIPTKTPRISLTAYASAPTITPSTKKRGRVSKNGSMSQATFVAPASTNGHLTSRGKTQGRGKAQSTPKPQNGRIVYREENCSFCGGTDDINRAGVAEHMVSCASCGRSGHPTCLNMLTPQLRKKVMTYGWHCIECKKCEKCEIKGDDSRLMFCDSCDRGWHSFCLDPPLAKPPKGSWHCPICQSSSNRSSAHSSLHKLAASNTTSSRKGKGKGPPSLVQDTMSTPTARGRKPNNRRTPSALAYEEDGLFENFVKVKLPRKDKGKGRAQQESEDEGPPMIVRLRVPSGKRDTAEAESEEEKVPYGGIITGDDADMSKTVITQTDKEAFDKSRLGAEAKLGGPPPPTWDPQLSLGASPAHSPGPLATPTNGKNAPPNGHSHGSLSRPLRDRLLQQSLSDSPAFPFPSTPGPSYTPHHASATSKPEKIKTIRFGQYDIDTWYSAPYPEEYAYVPDGRLWLCEFCLKYMKSGFVAGRHRLKCKVRHPPGDEIYREGNVSVFEVDGRKNKIYCQNLCLLAKMFLDHKTLYYDVEPFLFYVMTEVDELGARFVGYFSKEKRSIDNNVSCIMTLPVRQRKGWGQLLIDFSYLLSKKEGRVGSPEKPLSGLGAVTYMGYWRLAVFRYLQVASGQVTMDDISLATSMTLEDIYSVLDRENMIRVLDSPPRETPSKSRGRWRGRGRNRPSSNRKRESASEDVNETKIPSRYELIVDRAYVDAVLSKHDSKGYLKLRPDRLKYHPFLVTRNPTVHPVAIAQATLQAAGLDSTTTPSKLLVTSADGPIVCRSSSTGGEDVKKVVAGEDQATLDLVAELSSSPQRHLRKRHTDTEELESPVKRLRNKSSVSMSPYTRRSTRASVSMDAIGSDHGTGNGGSPFKMGARPRRSISLRDTKDIDSEDLSNHQLNDIGRQDVNLEEEEEEEEEEEQVEDENYRKQLTVANSGANSFKVLLKNPTVIVSNGNGNGIRYGEEQEESSEAEEVEEIEHKDEDYDEDEDAEGEEDEEYVE